MIEIWLQGRSLGSPLTFGFLWLFFCVFKVYDPSAPRCGDVCDAPRTDPMMMIDGFFGSIDEDDTRMFLVVWHERWTLNVFPMFGIYIVPDIVKVGYIISNVLQKICVIRRRGPFNTCLCCVFITRGVVFRGRIVFIIK